ncbi:glycerophosphodiester phosphodiesterase family protein [Granulicella sp. L60]|uniref:glycerophosphodiester phosphodiesterase n=1 Tax=Granulicella sp. L60 TaxID=1641866 RepID=UPI00131D29AC|nr:glycerophosphodiester phosphodiesterase family protein [Granulicella sp. L60]
MHSSILKLLIGSTLAGSVAFAQTAWTPKEDSKTIKVISHRGEHLHHPENTMPAFQAAIDAGADYFELDVRTTSDGKFVIMHDNTLDRTTNGTGEVYKHTFDEIRALDAGAKFAPAFAGTKVPTLDEAFDLAHGKINVYVDTKYADPQQLVDTIVKHDMQDHVVIYGNPFFLYEVRKIRPTLKVMPEALSPDVCKLFVRAMQLQVLAFDANDFKDPVIACATQANAKIYVDRLGDADNPEAWQKAIDLGAAGIQTNLPAELAAYLRTHNMATH